MLQPQLLMSYSGPQPSTTAPKDNCGQLMAMLERARTKRHNSCMGQVRGPTHLLAYCRKCLIVPDTHVHTHTHTHTRTHARTPRSP